MTVRALAVGLTVLTGFTGLVYEVAWQRLLSTLLGSHSEATAAVLGLFLGGLAVGYAAFGGVSRRVVEGGPERARTSRLLVVYGLIEAAIGLYALIFAVLFGWVRALSFLLPHAGGLGFALDVVLCAVLILPPAVLMGATIPLLTQALAQSLEDATRIHARIYAWNTAGAFAGALAAGFWLVPRLGLVGVLSAMAAVNVAVGGAYLVLSRFAGPARAGVAVRGAERVPGAAAFCSVALLCGFATMALQTVLIRLGGLSLGSSHFTFSMVVAVFVLCIALGSLVVSALPGIPRFLLAANLWALLLLLTALHGQLPDAPYWAHALRALFLSDAAAFYPFHAMAFLGALLVIGLPVALAGATLPLVFHQLRHRVGDLGGVAGRLYSWNTLGSLLGALLGGHVLLYWVDLDGVYRAAAACIAVAAGLATLLAFERPRVAPTALALGLGLAGVASLPGWSGERLASGLYRERAPSPVTFKGPEAFFRAFLGKARPDQIFYDDDPVISVAVRDYSRQRGRFVRALINNGKSEGSTSEDYLTMAFTGILPALFAERVERAFVIGYGIGVTAGELASLESAREVVVAEISPAVIDAAPLFDEANLAASKNPRVRVVQGDAFRTLMHSDQRFDVISSEPSNPWVTGVEMLFSFDFLRAARDHLTPGGVYAQWMHTYEMDTESVELVLRTYAAAFDHVAVWYAQGADLLLLGFRNGRLAQDLDRLERRAALPDFAASLTRAGVHGLPALLAHELLPLGVVHAMMREGEVHTLLHPRLSDRAARAFFLGSEGKMPFSGHLRAAVLGRRNSLAVRYAERFGGRLPEPERAEFVGETCRHRALECVTLLAQWTHDVPGSRQRSRLEAELEPLARERQIPLEDVARLVRLYEDGAGPRDPQAGDALQQAVAATEAFWSRYHHAAPFSREVLASLWDRCTAESEHPAQCARAREQAQRWLGPLPPSPVF